MKRVVLEVILADVALILAEYFVVQDLQWRTAYAATPHASAINGYVPSFSYGILTQFFTMAGSGISLTSPATLDWVQVIAVALVALNAWLGYSLLLTRRARVAAEAPRG